MSHFITLHIVFVQLREFMHCYSHVTNISVPLKYCLCTSRQILKEGRVWGYLTLPVGSFPWAIFADVQQSAHSLANSSALRYLTFTA